jgi:hypothetical protein
MLYALPIRLECTLAQPEVSDLAELMLCNSSNIPRVPTMLPGVNRMTNACHTSEFSSAWPLALCHLADDLILSYFSSS